VKPGFFVLIATLAGLTACAPADEPAVEPEFVSQYQGIKTQLMDNELVNFQVTMTGARDNSDVAAYAECAAAQYALIRGYGFARHVRTNVANEAGIWSGDAIYTISPTLPEGLRTIDAEVAVRNCATQGIPTV
jgi:hypothetical protein